MARYQSTKNTFIMTFLWGIVIALITIIVVAVRSGENNILSILFVLTTISLIIWILLDTRYVIKNNNLKYRSGPFRGKIDVLNIKKNEHYSGTNPPVTMKPALDNKGIILFYNLTDSIFVSPVSAEKFLIELKEINSNIEF